MISNAWRPWVPVEDDSRPVSMHSISSARPANVPASCLFSG